ncbi:MAG: transglutaminase domain-containing protein [Caldilineaceae bacterium]|nr:transglutaminase domain-containing protein [Caldilineaceae bacterium]
MLQLEDVKLLQFYATPGALTDPGAHAERFADLPADLALLCEIVQGSMIHIFWAERYELSLSDERKAEVQIRTVAQKLARLRELDDRPLTEARPLERKLVGNCRDFSLLLCAMLRHQGVPARARCGFGAYFLPNHYEDHWVCEYWNTDQARWVMVDAQLDALQRKVLHPPFDPLNVPSDQFLTGGKAWLICRAGEADPAQFGIFDMAGMEFIRGNLMRDVFALNKVEILPWDFGWGLITDDPIDVKGQTPELHFLDYLAHLTLGGDEAIAELRALCLTDRRLHIPEYIFN